MISEAMVEEALHYLLNSAAADAQAKANADYTGEWRKTERARLTMESEMKTAAGKAADAESHDEYLAALDVWKLAVYEDCRRRFLREAKATLIEAWRTQESTRRSLGTLA